MLPSKWDICALEDLALVERGKFSARPRNDPKYYGGHMPFVQTGDVTSAGTYLKSYTQTLNDDGISVSKVFPKNTILITIAANIGDTVITTFNVACPDSVVAIQPYEDKVDAFWLKKILEIKKQGLDSQSTQNAQKNINLQVLKPLQIKTPPLREQKKIAQILFTWDKAITTTEQLLANGQQQKKALMQQLLIGKKRLLDDNGVRFNERWTSTSLLKFIKESRIVGRTGDMAKKLTVKLYGLGVFPKDEKRIGSKSTKYYRRAAGQFIYSKLDFLNGAFGIIPEGLDGYESTLDLPAFDFLPGVCVHWFIYYVSREEFYTANLGLANGGRKARRVNPKDFLQIKIPSPCLEEQQKIAAVLSATDQEIDALQKKLDYLRQEKKALMQQLLTGKRRVNVEVA
jgi:type I restriction enzyme, S subunit